MASNKTKISFETYTAECYDIAVMTYPFPVDNVVAYILAAHDSIWTHGIAQKLLSLCIRHVESDLYRTLPVFADHLKHLRVKAMQ